MHKKIFYIWLMILLLPLNSLATDFKVQSSKVLKTYNEFIWDIDYSPAGSYFAIAGGNKSVEIYDKNFRIITEIEGLSSNEGLVAFSPDEKHIAIGRYIKKSSVIIYNFKNNSISQKINERSGDISSLEFSPSGKYLVIGNKSSEILIYEKTGKLYKKTMQLEGSPGYMSDVCFSRDEKLIVAPGPSNSVNLFKISDGNISLLQKLKGHSKDVNTVAISNNNKYIISGDHGGKIFVWKRNSINTDNNTNATDRKFWGISARYTNSQKITANKYSINCLEFSADGKFFAAGCNNRKLFIWKKQNNNFIKDSTHTKHTNDIYSLSFSHDGKNLITGGFDDSVVVWNLSGIKQTDKIVRKKQSIDRTPPEIVITSPEVTRGIKIIKSSKRTVIKGKAIDTNRIFEVLVNGEEAYTEPDGNFSHPVLLGIGENTFTVTATDIKQNTSTKRFTISRLSGKKQPLSINTKKKSKNLKGEYHALIIGVQEYQDPDITDLDRPVNDAVKLVNILTEDYTFKRKNIKFLKNPTKNRITKMLDYYFSNITENDNLLIFYAGHGYWDDRFKQGYWLASDADKNNRGTWLSNGTIRDYLRAIPSKHSLLITDACFGGGIFKSRNAFANSSVAINQLYKLPSRKAMTSGALKEVPDKSVFIEYLVKRLKQNTKNYLSSEQLFASFKIAVINNSSNNQVPQFGEVKETGDEGGDFIFMRK